MGSSAHRRFTYRARPWTVADDGPGAPAHRRIRFSPDDDAAWSVACSISLDEYLTMPDAELGRRLQAALREESRAFVAHGERWIASLNDMCVNAAGICRLGVGFRHELSGRLVNGHVDECFYAPSRMSDAELADALASALLTERTQPGERTKRLTLDAPAPEQGALPGSRDRGRGPPPAPPIMPF